MKHAMVACALALASSGCRAQADDLCADPSLDGMTCLSIEVTGQLEGASQLDSLQLDVSYPTTALINGYMTSIGADKRVLIQPVVADGGAALADGGGVGLPIEFPVVFPSQIETEEGVQVIAEALYAGQPVGLGHETYDPQPTTHSRAQLTIGPITPTRCFDGSHDGNESDVDCGGPECPACPKGSECSGNYSNTSDCVGSYCTEDPNQVDVYHCE